MVSGQWSAVFTTLAFCIAAKAPAADESASAWIVDTRCAAHDGDLDAAMPDLRYFRLHDDGCWSSSESDAQAFRATDDRSTPTIVFVHGNATDAREAIAKGLYAYELIRAEAAGRPFRYVIWSWPADRVCRRLRDDFHLKTAYSDAESYYLARWLDGIEPGVKLSLIGHSLGPRIITGALHLLAGGAVADQRMPDAAVAAWSAGQRNPVRTMLLAAAIDADWLNPDGCHGRALSLVDRALITSNGCDRVLRWYPWAYGRGGPLAIGAVGPCGLEESPKVEVLDIDAEIGKVHNWYRHCATPSVHCRWAQYTFLEASP